MQVYAALENSIYIEMAIATLEKNGIPKANIYAVPLDNRSEDRKLFDSLHNSDGTSLIDIGVALATAFSVIGTSIGFELAWGPIYWGLIASLIGFVLGVAIRLYTEKVFKKRKRLLKRKRPEVILIIECEKAMAELVENILLEHLALGVAKVK
ncbi:hypothetical protein [Oceanobacillus sp. FSL W7-1293]|uniref:hypothetical protein n=1 Tax=Oceanobacillus sp. FSL W7-1293 TaxID=2921699 RepID=UPI0030D37B48